MKQQDFKYQYYINTNNVSHNATEAAKTKVEFDKMRRRTNKIIAIAFVSFCILWILRGLYKKNELEDRFALTTGQVSKITTPGWKSSGDYSVLYEFELNNKKYNGNSNYHFCGNLNQHQIRQLIVNKYFPVAYDPKDPSNHAIILTRQTAERFRYALTPTLFTYDSILTCK